MAKPGVSTKASRQLALSRYLENNPLLTDEELAGLLRVSVQTVRLDRSELSIPELRERLKKLATAAGRAAHEPVFTFVLPEPGAECLPVQTVITPAMVTGHGGLNCTDYLFVLANRLALNLVNAGISITRAAKVSFKRPLKVGEKTITKAMVNQQKGNKFMVRVMATVRDELVFEGKFLIFALSGEGGVISCK
ncbi:MAG TPA: transcription factor FapR [Spirochaetia bacterium]|nr:transcription factor FapR [Spirochaetia bacterium]